MILKFIVAIIIFVYCAITDVRRQNLNRLKIKHSKSEYKKQTFNTKKNNHLIPGEFQVQPIVAWVDLVTIVPVQAAARGLSRVVHGVQY